MLQQEQLEVAARAVQRASRSRTGASRRRALPRRATCDKRPRSRRARAPDRAQRLDPGLVGQCRIHRPRRPLDPQVDRAERGRDPPGGESLELPACRPRGQLRERGGACAVGDAGPASRQCAARRARTTAARTARQDRRRTASTGASWKTTRWRDRRAQPVSRGTTSRRPRHGHGPRRRPRQPAAHRHRPPRRARRGEHERTLQPAGAGTEDLHTSQYEPARALDDVPPPSPPPALGPLPTRRREDGRASTSRQVALAHPVRGLHGQPLECVEVTVEDPADRAVGCGDPAHERELARRSRALGTGVDPERGARRPARAVRSLPPERPARPDARARRRQRQSPPLHRRGPHPA